MDHSGHHGHHVMDNNVSTTLHQHHHETTTMGMDHVHDAMSSHGNMSGHGMGHPMMAMYFHSEIGNDYVLLKQWKPTTTSGSYELNLFCSFLSQTCKNNL